MLSTWVLGGAASAQVGTSEVVWDVDDDLDEVIVATITSIDTDEVWIAAEFRPNPLGAPNTKKVRLQYFDGSSWSDKTFSPTLTSADSNHYPSIVAPIGSEYVYVTTKHPPDAAHDEPYYWVLKQDRDDMTQSAFWAELGSDPDIRHKRPFLGFDYEFALGSGDATEALYLCWTEAEVPPNNDDNLRLKASDDFSPWGTVWSSAVTNDLEVNAGSGQHDDHCTLAFSEDGTTFAAFHNFENLHDEIAFELESFGGASWAALAPAGGNLTPIEGAEDHLEADFPVIASAVLEDVVHDWITSYWIVAQSLTDDDYTLTWSCTGTVSDCNEPNEWVGLEQDLGGTTQQTQPMVVALPLLGHAFLLTELSTEEIGVASWCEGETEWTVLGTADHDSAYNRVAWANARGSAVSAVSWGGDLGEDPVIHAAMAGRESADASVDLLHWSLDVCSVCSCP